MTLIKVVNGDLVEAEENLIIHQVNCLGKMNSGVAKTIRVKWGRVFDRYSSMCREYDSFEILGQVQSVLVDESKKQYVVNMFSQHSYGYDGERYTNYEALYRCLEQVANVARKHNYSVAIPYKMGCDRGGANWNVVYTMIEEVFKNHTQPVTIYRIDDQFQHAFVVNTTPNHPTNHTKELVFN